MTQRLAAAALVWGTASLYEGEEETLLPANEPQHHDDHPTAPAAIALLPEETLEGPDLNACWEAFVGDESATLRGIARQHGVSGFVLVRMARRERWEEQRAELWAARHSLIARAA